jgi:hypothetical protein
MNLIDLVEMFCDWEASILKNKDGDIYRSIDINKTRFNMSDDLMSIFKNTADLLKDWDLILNLHKLRDRR